MAANSIDTILKTTLEQLKSLVDVQTILGQPIHTESGEIILPVSRVSTGFVAGGAERAKAGDATVGEYPFGGGAGGGASVCPVGFLVVGNDKVRVLPVDTNGSAVERIIEAAPQLLREVKHLFHKDIHKVELQKPEE